MRWRESNKSDPPALALADRHYSRQKPGSKQFMRPGRTCVLVTVDELAVWGCVWPKFQTHAWAGVPECSIFRNEGAGLSSELILEATAATRDRWPELAEVGLLTFVDADAVRHKRDPGRCFLKAGFLRVGETSERGRLVFYLPPWAVPAAEPALARDLVLV